MNTTLFEPAPDFDQPIAVLKHCHDRIRKQLQTLGRLPAHLAQHGADDEARRAAAGVARYFGQAALLHHADEEDDLLPMLEQVAAGEDAAQLRAILPQIMAEHERMEAAWRLLAPRLDAIAGGRPADLPQEDVDAYAALYGAHMEREETIVAPMAKRLFGADRMAALGAAMRNRRGL